jgi:hypothetical protein
MTIDERLEALTARHEALTARHEALAQSMELTHLDIQDLARTAGRHDAEIDKIMDFIRETSTTVRALAEIAQAHGQRITRIEDSKQ